MRLLKVLLVVLVSMGLLACNDSQEASRTTSVAATALKDFLASSTKPAVIKFHAEWCSTCKGYKPRFEKVRETMSGRVDFFEVDVDEVQYKALLKEVRVARIPVTLLVRQDRARVSKKLGNL